MTASPPDPPPPPHVLLSYARLFRLPNVFTALADVAMGLVYTAIPLGEWGVWLGLLAATACLYTAGMVLNDVYDYEQDKRERPFRPLPSGAISLRQAALLGRRLLVSGVLLATLVGVLQLFGATAVWRPSAVAAALAIGVLLYDVKLKRTPAGPLCMGACRFFNVLLGMSLGLGGKIDLAAGPVGFTADQLLVAGGIGTYIVGVTWLARSEARSSHRGQLAGAIVVMIGGLAMLALFPRYGDFAGVRQIQLSHGNTGIMWPALVLLLGMVIVRRAAAAVVDPTPAKVQAAVKLCILSLIMLDGAVTLAVGGPLPAVAVLALLVPMLILGRWVYST